jgi:hypothetical protein
MSWQEKLQTLINAHEQGHPLVSVFFDYSTSLEPEAIAMVLQELEQAFDAVVPSTLRDFYGITDGMLLDVGQRVFGLRSQKYELLENMNNSYLEIVKERTTKVAQEAPTLIFGSDEAGDFLCLSSRGEVVRVGHDAIEAVVIANSIDELFDDIWLGPGYIRYYEPMDDHFWLLILKEFGFVSQ